MTGETKIPASAVFAGMLMACQIIVHLAQVTIQNDSAVELDFHCGTLDGDLLIVPLINRVLVPSLCGYHAVGGAMGLTGIDLFSGCFLVIVVEDLAFTHAKISRIA